MNRILTGDVREVLPGLPRESYDCVVTSPPYWALRDYGDRRQLGLEPSPWRYLSDMVDVFREVRRVMKPRATLWLNMGDTYASNGGGTAYKDRVIKHKDLVGLPWRLALALQEDGWYLRRDNVWHKPNCLPEQGLDRPTTSHEYVFLLSKSKRYHYDRESVKEPCTGNAHSRGIGQYQKIKKVAGWSSGPGRHSTLEHNSLRRVRIRANPSFSKAVRNVLPTRNLRSVWTFPAASFQGGHFATFPLELPLLCLRAGCPKGGRVLDPFGGAGTTGLAAQSLGLGYDLVELVPGYAEMAQSRGLDCALFDAAATRMILK